MDTQSNSINWFEIPAADIDRAKTFYETVFDCRLEAREMMGMKTANFPFEMGSGKAHGGLVQSENHKPSSEGAVLYLNANPSMDPILERIPEAGGQILMPKMEIGEGIGFMAFFMDSEGNKLGLHASN